MKLLTGCLVLALLGATTSADAWPSWPWSRNRKPRLPQSIDSPVVRPKLKTEKVNRQHHARKYLEGDWGQEWYRTLDLKQQKEGNHSIFRD